MNLLPEKALSRYFQERETTTKGITWKLCAWPLEDNASWQEDDYASLLAMFQLLPIVPLHFIHFYKKEYTGITLKVKISFEAHFFNGSSYRGESLDDLMKKLQRHYASVSQACKERSV